MPGRLYKEIGQMSVCVECTKEIDPGSNFCIHCGSAQLNLGTTTCVACGSDNQVNEAGLCFDCSAMAIAMDPSKQVEESELVDQGDGSGSPEAANMPQQKTKVSRAGKKLGPIKDEEETAQQDLEPSDGEVQTEASTPAVEIVVADSNQLDSVISTSNNRRGYLRLTVIGAVAVIVLGAIGTIISSTSSSSPGSLNGGGEAKSDGDFSPNFELGEYFSANQLELLASESCSRFDTFLKSYIDPDQYFERDSGLSGVSSRREAEVFYSKNSAWMDLPSYQEAFKTATTLLAAEIVLSQIPASELANYSLDELSVGDEFRPVLVLTCDQPDEDGTQEKFYEKTSAALGKFDEKIQAVLALMD